MLNILLDIGRFLFLAGLCKFGRDTAANARVRPDRWIVTIPSSDQWLATIGNHWKTIATNGFWTQKPLENHCYKWFLNGFWSSKPLVAMVFQWFPMVANHWSNDGIVTIHRSGLAQALLNSLFLLRICECFFLQKDVQLFKTNLTQTYRNQYKLEA